MGTHRLKLQDGLILKKMLLPILLSKLLLLNNKLLKNIMLFQLKLLTIKQLKKLFLPSNHQLLGKLFNLFPSITVPVIKPMLFLFNLLKNPSKKKEGKLSKLDKLDKFLKLLSVKDQPLISLKF